MLTRSLLAACVLAFSAPAVSDDSHHPGTTPAAKMPEVMQRMHQQMKQMQAATDPTERQRLMEEHMQTMAESMPMMMEGMNQRMERMEQMMQKIMQEHQKEHGSAPR